MVSTSVDAVVVGAGPNGLTAAITLAQAGLAVQVYEAGDTVGGAARTAELTTPGFLHDVGSAVHPLAAGSPVFTTLPLGEHGLEWLEPGLCLAHPFDDGSAAVLARSVSETAASLGRGGRGYRQLVRPFVGRWDRLSADVMRPVLSGLPHSPMLLARFGMRAVLPVETAARRVRSPSGRALLAGIAGHTGSPLSSPVTAGPALMMAVAGHDVGWPVPRGGAQAVSDALASYARSLGVVITTGQHVESLDELTEARAYLLDTSPWALPALAGRRIPSRYARRLARYRAGPGAFKIDYALREPVPWRVEACRRAGTVHLGGTEEEVAVALRAIRHGHAAERPLVVVAQPSLIDPTRAPEGHHTLWVYAHVPNGWAGDLTDAIEGQLERFAPGFRDVVLARAVSTPADLERTNANLVGGDIADGAVDGWQAIFRPVFARFPYATPHPAVFLCSAATAPGPGVHGVCGAAAARLALRRVFGVPSGSPGK
jgi:phytoene dehydrogenase-like protein